MHPEGKLYYSMGEVCELFGVKPSLIRFWEENFSILKPHRNNKGNRLFTPADVDNIGLIYNLVKERGMTLAGAEKKIKEDKRGKNKLMGNVEVIQLLQKIRNLLNEVKEDLDGSEKVVARFDDYGDVEMPGTVKLENVLPDEVNLKQEEVFPEIENIGNDDGGRLEMIVGKEEIENNSPSVVESETKTVEEVSKSSKGKRRGKSKSRGGTTATRKSKLMFVEQSLDLFSSLDNIDTIPSVSSEKQNIAKVEVVSEASDLDDAGQNLPEPLLATNNGIGCERNDVNDTVSENIKSDVPHNSEIEPENKLDNATGDVMQIYF